MSETDRENPKFKIVGDLLWLDFVNTAPMLEGARVETMDQFSDLIGWCKAAGLLSKRQAQETESRWAGTAEAKAAFAAAIEFRATLRTLAEQIVTGKPASSGAIEAINRILATRLSSRRLVREGRGFKTMFTPQAELPMDLLVAMAESAADLLEHGNINLIRECENPVCGLYFYDTTKNRSRRWCSMEVCGSRAKAAAYYRRKRASKARRQQ